MKLNLRSSLFIFAIFSISWFVLSRCEQEAVGREGKNGKVLIAEKSLVIDPLPASSEQILAKKEIPVLCYHQIRDYRESDGPVGKPYIVPPAVFAEQMKELAEKGYRSILPEELHQYLVYGKSLPEKSVLISFDDTRLDQYTAALPELDKNNFKGAFFIMTVSLGRPGYMSREQVKDLSDQGHSIGSHTWDHGNVNKYEAADWIKQIDKPSATLKSITGKEVKHFAYPFGLWNENAIEHLKKRNFDLVFQLADKRDESDPLYTVRRIIVPGTWSGKTLIRNMEMSFK